MVSGGYSQYGGLDEGTNHSGCWREDVMGGYSQYGGLDEGGLLALVRVSIRSI